MEKQETTLKKDNWPDKNRFRLHYRLMGEVERPDEDPEEEPVERDGELTAPLLLLERNEPDEPEDTDEDDPEEEDDL